MHLKNLNDLSKQDDMVLLQLIKNTLENADQKF